jgi:hypothetical protein
MINMNDEPWQCRFDGWRIKFDDLSLPFWSWANIEQFWVDATSSTVQYQLLCPSFGPSSGL